MLSAGGTLSPTVGGLLSGRTLVRARAGSLVAVLGGRTLVRAGSLVEVLGGRTLVRAGSLVPGFAGTLERADGRSLTAEGAGMLGGTLVISGGGSLLSDVTGRSD